MGDNGEIGTECWGNREDEQEGSVLGYRRAEGKIRSESGIGWQSEKLSGRQLSGVLGCSGKDWGGDNDLGHWKQWKSLRGRQYWGTVGQTGKAEAVCDWECGRKEWRRHCHGILGRNGAD